MDKLKQLAKWIAKDILIKLQIPFDDKKLNNWIQFFKFCLVGISNTLISYFAYLFLVIIGTHYIFASMIGFFVSVMNSFYWNNKYVFMKKSGGPRKLVKTFCKTLVAYSGTGIFLSNILLFIWVSVVHIPKEVAPLLNLCVTVPMNFLINKFWAYKAEK